MSWIHLRVHSQYSILDSTLSIETIVKTASDMNMPAIALTDAYNMHGAVDFYKECKAAKIKPLIGCELFLAPQGRLIKKKTNTPIAFPLTLIAKNKIGYKNLCKLSTLGYVEGFYYYPRIDKEILKEHKEGLICISGGPYSSVNYLIKQNKQEELLEEINWFKENFQDDYYFEITRHHMSLENLKQDQMEQEAGLLQKYQEFIRDEKKSEEFFLEYGGKNNVKCVATSNIRYLHREDWMAHEILLNIASSEVREIWEYDQDGNPKARILNPKRKNAPSHEFYFKSPEEMKLLFQDIPQTIETNFEIAEKCSFNFDLKTKHYPVFYPPNIDMNTNEEERKKCVNTYLYDLCFNNIENRYSEKLLEKIRKKYPNQDPLKIVKDRLTYEFEVISSKEMCDYLLIVYDFIAWAKKQNIIVGPGRGSAAGSIICYLIGITDIEPLTLGLFFERFINPERISYPDIDVDICMERRSEVINYTVNKYGKEKVAQIVTFGTMKAKMAIRDVARVLSVNLVKVNNIAKLVPEDLNMTLEKALVIEPELKKAYESDEEIKMIIDMARKIEGSIRNTGIHAAGIIISASELTDHIPLCVAKDSDMLVTQYSMKPVEIVGMLKIDFLGLKTLTSIQKTKEAVEKNYNINISLSDLPLDDKSTYDLLNQCKTLGVFQLESGGMQDLIKQLHIEVFEEIIAVGALYRPGPMDMIPSFINRKHKREVIEIDHPLMTDILSETYGVMVYQEQVMQIASKLAGYSLGEGDVLRRAMGKKDKNEMKKQKEKFVQGAGQNGIDEITALKIFEKIEKFASYGFNKSHAAAYAYLSYITAYFKANYPKEWMASLLTSDRDDLTKVAKLIRECAEMKINIFPPNVNESGVEFNATKEGIRFAMCAIKGMGEIVVQSIVQEREKNGLYKSLYDFIKRLEIGKKNIELLIHAGAFDFTKWSRDAMLLSFEKMYVQAAKQKKEKAQGVVSLFSLLGENEDDEFTLPPMVENKTAAPEILRKEKELLGFYLTAHPLDYYKDILSNLSCVPLKDISLLPKDTIFRAAFVIENITVKLSLKTQKKFAIVTAGDGDNRFELFLWPEIYENKSSLLIENNLLYTILQLTKSDEGTIRLQCRWLEDLNKVDQKIVDECDKTYNQLKEQFKLQSLRKKTPQKVVPSILKNDVTIEVDANTISLNKILTLKEILQNHPGLTKINISFIANNKKIGIIALGARLGVEFSENLEKSLKEIAGIIAIKASL